jgi:tRNA dimethylallyltransferase
LTRHLALVGPTATGKSAVALAIARSCPDVELCSLDSMQVYRGMDIGTAKPSPAELAEVRHHLVDVADPDEEWSVKRTQHLSHDALADIERRGKRAILVGGTGLYVRAVVDALEIPGGDDAVRAQYEEATQTDAGLAAAYARLQRDDPVAAGRIEPDNRRRIVRALEVIAVTGRPFSSFGPGLDVYAEPAIDVRIVGLAMPADDLATRIGARVSGMRANGLVAEVDALARRPAGLSKTAAQAIGYKEVLAHLDGALTLDDAFDLVVRRTRQFARRQRVWFARDPRITWVDAGSQKTEALADTVLATWSAPVPVASSQ